MRKPRLLLTAAALLLTLTSGLVGLTSNEPAQAAIGPVTWSDEFDAPAGTPLDNAKWKFDTGGGGWGNNELQYYTNSTSNAAHDGQGHLVITARRENPANYQCQYGTCQYTSGRILTADKFTQAYGRFEARIKIPRGQGIWPAFWMLGRQATWPTDRRDRHHGERRPGAEHRPRHHARPRLLRRQRHRRQPHHRRAARRRLPHLRGRLGARTSIVWYLDGSEYFRVTPADIARQPVGLRPPVLHDPERGGRRQLAGQPGRQHRRSRRRCSSTTSASPPTTHGGNPRHRHRRCAASAERPLHRHPRRQPRRRRPAADLGLQRHRRAAVDLRRRRHGPRAGQVHGRRRRPAPPTARAIQLVHLQRHRRAAVHPHRRRRPGQHQPPTGASTSWTATPPTARKLQLWDCTGGANQKWTRS